MSTIEREREQDVQVDERERRASVLEAAALEIEVRGWCQGRTEERDGSVCMVGAISYAAGLDRSNNYGTNATAIFGRDWDKEEFQLPDWNDVCPDRTAAEVCFVLRWRAQEIRDGR